MTSSTDSIRLVVRGLVEPGFQQKLPATGTVSNGRRVDIDGVDMTVKLPSDADIEPGTELRVTMKGGHLHAQTMEAYEREQYERKAKAHLKERERRKKRRKKREEAEEFWARHEIPFDFDVAIKGRRSGLGKGSWSDGRAENTVEHLFVEESFQDGRLSRGARTYLCSPSQNPEFEFTEERHLDENGNNYVPKITCKQCLDMMKRWEISDSALEQNSGEVSEE